MENELPTPYNIFWRELRPALQAAGVTFERYIAAIKRLKAIEGELTGPGTGQTGYLNNNDPYRALEEYIAWIKGEADKPFWLRSAEGG